MTRRVVKTACDVEACREIRPTTHRQFQSGTVLNILQWVTPEVARFTIEGEGVEIWCCPQAILNERTEAPERSLSVQA